MEAYVSPSVGAGTFFSLTLYFMAYSCNYSASTSCHPNPPFIKSNNHSSVCQTLSIPNLAATTRLELQPLMTSRHKKTKRTPKYHEERIHPLQSTRDVLSGHGWKGEGFNEKDEQKGEINNLVCNGHWKTIVTSIIFYSVIICNVLQSNKSFSSSSLSKRKDDSRYKPRRTAMSGNSWQITEGEGRREGERKGKKKVTVGRVGGIKFAVEEERVGM